MTSFVKDGERHISREKIITKVVAGKFAGTMLNYSVKAWPGSQNDGVDKDEGDASPTSVQIPAHSPIAEKQPSPHAEKPAEDKPPVENVIQRARPVRRDIFFKKAIFC